jgi:hypothetical protein
MFDFETTSRLRCGLLPPTLMPHADLRKSGGEMLTRIISALRVHGLFMSDILMLSLVVLRRKPLLRRAALLQAPKLCSFGVSAATVSNT